MERISTKSYAFIIVSYTIVILSLSAWENELFHSQVKLVRKELNDYEIKQDDYLRPLIFIGGYMRSGTTLIRTMLDAHPDIRCGPETSIIRGILGVANDLYKDHREQLERVGLLRNIQLSSSLNVTWMDDFFRRLVLNIVLKLDPSPTKYYCNKEPTNMLHPRYLKKLFPKSKFICMVRDPRACVISRLQKQFNLTYPSIYLYKRVLEDWNSDNEDMFQQCSRSMNCLIQNYEQLVLQPVRETKKIFKFLNIPWNVEVLHHERHLNTTKINPLELSSKQVQKPIYLDALTEWFGTVPISPMELDTAAPMMKLLGYDPYNDKPFYGDPDDFVLKKGKWKDTNQ